MKEHSESAVQSTALIKEAAGAVLASVLSRVDGWLCDYGDEPLALDHAESDARPD
jgi:hypothetical protein